MQLKIRLQQLNNIMTPTQFEKETKSLIDSLKSICFDYWLGGDGGN
jgi:hypothetical protein